MAKHVTSNTARQWLASLAVAAALFVFFMQYHEIRGKPWSLFTANKCIGITAALCLGLALALGPISRFTPRLAGLLPYRRSFGLLSPCLVALHVLLSLFALPEKFPVSWFVEHLATAITGAAALLLLVPIAISSYPWCMKRLGRRSWLGLQKASYLVMLLVIAHLLSLGKVPGWIEWLQTFDKPLPPGAFTTTAVCLVVLVLKLIDIIAHGDRVLLGKSARRDPDETLAEE